VRDPCVRFESDMSCASVLAQHGADLRLWTLSCSWALIGWPGTGGLSWLSENYGEQLEFLSMVQLPEEEMSFTWSSEPGLLQPLL